MRSICLAVAIV